MKETTNNTAEDKKRNFIEQIIEEDIQNNKNEAKVHTRFPPEPNGYLHIGHAKSICLNFGLGKNYKGKTNLRFDDTNPEKEETEYVESIKTDIQWLGFDWNEQVLFTSDYFEQLYEMAVTIIQKGNAYVCELSAEELSTQRGTPTQPGQESPYRNRSVEENLDLFERMRNGEFENGKMMLRAKIDMTSPNMHMRDPIMYRIRHVEHHRTGNQWCIYPMYDFAHGQSDYIEGITHSVCTLEFEIHRPLYDWFLDQVADESKVRPQQIEFARLNLNYTVMSKRKLLQLVQENHVSGWDDPRMPTISGLRRRGYTPESIRNFAETVGVARRNGVSDVALLEYSIRENLNKRSARVMAVLDPVKLVIENYPEDKTETVRTENNPEEETPTYRELPFDRELYIERADFMENPPRKFFRLGIDREVRLKSAYIIKCVGVEKDSDGNITLIRCTYDQDSLSGSGTEASKRKVKGTLHWVSVKHAINAEVRLYDRLFSDESPDSNKEKDFKEFINPNSLEIRKECKLEPSLATALVGDKVQFQRLGYFCVDTDSAPNALIFNRTVPLRDSWSKKK